MFSVAASAISTHDLAPDARFPLVLRTLGGPAAANTPDGGDVRFEGRRSRDGCGGARAASARAPGASCLIPRDDGAP